MLRLLVIIDTICLIIYVLASTSRRTVPVLILPPEQTMAGNMNIEKSTDNKQADTSKMTDEEYLKRYGKPRGATDSLGFKLPSATKTSVVDGGEGSGNHGHAGIEGEQGGSAPQGQKDIGINSKITLDATERKEYNKVIKDTITATGEKVNGFRDHAYDQIKERGVTPEEILEALKEPQYTHPGNKDARGETKVFVGSTARIVLGLNNGLIITVTRKGAN